MQYYSPSEDEDNTVEPTVKFQTRTTRNVPNVWFYWTSKWPQTISCPPPQNKCTVSPFSIYILFFGPIFQIILDESKYYFHQYMAPQDSTSTKIQTITWYYDQRNIQIFHSQFKWDMTSMTASKIIGSDNSNTTLHSIWMWRCIIHSPTF
jgi:hypothetical protein